MLCHSLPVLAVADLDEAIKFINARPKPLSLYIYSSNKKAQQKVLQSTSSGSVGVNECIYQVTLLCCMGSCTA